MTLEASIDELGRTALQLKRERDALLAAAQRIERALNICTRCPWCAITADGPTDEHTDTCWVPDLRAAIEEATP